MANLNKISTFATSNTIPHYIFLQKITGLAQLSFERHVRGVWSDKIQNHILHIICTT